MRPNVPGLSLKQQNGSAAARSLPPSGQVLRQTRFSVHAPSLAQDGESYRAVHQYGSLTRMEDCKHWGHSTLYLPPCSRKRREQVVTLFRDMRVRRKQHVRGRRHFKPDTWWRRMRMSPSAINQEKPNRQHKMQDS